MTKKKVLYVTKKSGGGAAFSLFYMASRLDRTRFDPMVAFFNVEKAYIPNALRQHNVPVYVLGSPPRQRVSSLKGSSYIDNPKNYPLSNHNGNPGKSSPVMLRKSASAVYRFVAKDLRHVPAVVNLIARVKPDLIHLNNWTADRAGAAAARWCKIPCVAHVRNFGTVSIADKWLLKYVEKLLAISTAVSEHFENQGLPETLIQLLPNAVDLDEFANSNNVEQTRTELGLAVKDVVIGSIGRLDWWKGHEVIIKALSNIVEVIPEAKLLIVGETEENSARNRCYPEELRQLVETLNLSEKVIFTGFRSDISSIMRACDIVVHAATRPEPFGRVVIEAMAANRPVVCSAAGGVLDIITHEETGLLVPPGDPNALAAAVIRILKQPDFSQQLTLAAHKRVERAFSVTIQIEHLERLYHKVLSD
jgi:glycosyltransferase involved in cell wall biosynthesis